MSLTFFADVCAHLPPVVSGEKSSYPRIGSAFRDTKDDRIVLKIDTLPLSGSTWQGWVNLFSRDGKVSSKNTVWKDGPEDDIPF